MKEVRLLGEWRDIFDIMLSSKAKPLQELSSDIENYIRNESGRMIKTRYVQVFVGNKKVKRIDEKGEINDCVENVKMTNKLPRKTLSVYYTYKNETENETDMETTHRLLIENDNGLYMFKGKDGKNKIFVFRIKDNNISHFKEVKNPQKNPEISEKIKL